MEQTLAVARSLFAEQGYAAVTMDEVAAEVGVTKPLLYNYFGNKEGLYAACMERAGDALSATIAASVASTSTPEEAMRAGGHAFFAFLDSERAAWAVLFDESLPRAVALLGAAEALAHWWRRTEALSAEEAADLLIATIEPGLRLRWAPVAKSTSKAKPKGSRK